MRFPLLAAVMLTACVTGSAFAQPASYKILGPYDYHPARRAVTYYYTQPAQPAAQPAQPAADVAAAPAERRAFSAEPMTQPNVAVAPNNGVRRSYSYEPMTTTRYYRGPSRKPGYLLPRTLRVYNSEP